MGEPRTELSRLGLAFYSFSLLFGIGTIALTSYAETVHVGGGCNGTTALAGIMYGLFLGMLMHLGSTAVIGFFLTGTILMILSSMHRPKAVAHDSV